MEELTGLRRADAAIVGGGLTGLLLGASLAAEGMKVAILEGAVDAFPQHYGAASPHAAPLLARAEAAHGTEAARQYASALQTQLHAILSTPLPYVQHAPLYTFALTKAGLPALETQHALYTRLHLPVHIAPDAGGCPFPVELSLLAPGQAIVDLHRWTAALTSSIRRQGGRIYPNSRITGFEGHRIFTASGCIHAPLTILTTGVPPDFDRESLLEYRSYAHGSLVSDAPLHSIQQSVQGDFSLCPTPFGAIATLDAGRCGTRQQREQLIHASAHIRRFLPDWQQSETQYSRHILTADGLPFIGTQQDSHKLFAVGASGLLGAMHAATVLTRHTLGRTLPEDALYSPQRKLPQAIIRREKRRNDLLRATNWLRLGAPECSHCGCRMHYTAPLSWWECPLCGSACTMLGQPVAGPGMEHVVVSPRQRPEY